MSDENRLFLKTELIRLIQKDLDAQDALSMQQHSRIYETIGQLKEINPHPQPLTLENLPKLVGDWKVLCSIKRNHNFIGTETILNKGAVDVKIRQNSNFYNTQTINYQNSLLIKLSAFAEWGIELEGVWEINDNQTVMVKLKEFEFKLTQPFIIPGFKIPIFDLFPMENLWKISYLDEDMLLGQDDTDTLFVFSKSR